MDLEIRDDKDTNRENSPLRKAVDAVEIDTSELTIDEQVNKIINHIKNNSCIDTFLVGESLMKSDNLIENLRNLIILR